jgi:hypothetical protein
MSLERKECEGADHMKREFGFGIRTALSAGFGS